MTFSSECATWREIMQQPDVWRDFAPRLEQEAQQIGAWIRARGIREIWFCGAGTSAFIGDIIAARPIPGLLLKAVATTDIVATPQDFFPLPPDVLVVQFGRSGNSSESIGLLDLLDTRAPQADRLHITCNPDGALATRAAPGPGEARVLNLPEVTHDVGFAMTSSFTTMLLSALAVLDGSASRLPALADQAEELLRVLSVAPKDVPARAIFLGSGPLKGVARESALKVLELTAGRVTTQWDSTLGFRHGPKAAVTNGAQIAVMLHPDRHTAMYDADIASEIARQYPRADVVTLGNGGTISIEGTGDAAWDGVLYVLAAQVWAVMWSDALQLDIDDPFRGQGNLSRVVSGVTLYPWEGERA